VESKIDDLIILYDSSVEITGRFYYKDELKIKEGNFGPYASFSILIEKPRKDKIAKHYIFTRVYGDKLVEKLKRIKKGTFIRVLGELESSFGGTYVNVKVLTPVSTVELQEMLSRQKEPEPEDLYEEFANEKIDEEDVLDETFLSEDELTKETEPEPEPVEVIEKQEIPWSSGWSKKKRRGIF
jgi:hypothetical protein